MQWSLGKLKTFVSLHDTVLAENDKNRFATVRVLRLNINDALKRTVEAGQC